MAATKAAMHTTTNSIANKTHNKSVHFDQNILDLLEMDKTIDS